MYIKHGKVQFSRRDTYSLDYPLGEIISSAVSSFSETLQQVAFGGVPTHFMAEIGEEDADKAFKLWVALLDTMTLAFDPKYHERLENEALDWFSKVHKVDIENHKFEIQDIGSDLEKRAYKEAERLLAAEAAACEEARIAFGKYFKDLWW